MRWLSRGFVPWFSGDLNRDDLTSRGFTQHEHLNGFDLIHMNGRAYDYNLGRFLSVDPIIQFPENSQSLNPYSYIMNNPMSGTDPTGYCAAATGTRIKSCGDLKVDVQVNGKGAGSTVIKDVNFNNGADVGSAMSKGAGRIGAAINNGNMGQSGVTNPGSANSDLLSQKSSGNIGSGRASGMSSLVSENELDIAKIKKVSVDSGFAGPTSKSDEVNMTAINSGLSDLRDVLNLNGNLNSINKFNRTDVVYSPDGSLVDSFEYGGVAEATIGGNSIVFSPNISRYTHATKHGFNSFYYNSVILNGGRGTIAFIVAHEFGHVIDASSYTNRQRLRSAHERSANNYAGALFSGFEYLGIDMSNIKVVQ